MGLKCEISHLCRELNEPPENVTFPSKKIHFSFHSKTATFSSTFQKFRWQIRLLADKNHNLLLRKCNGTTLNQKMYYSLPILTCPFLYIGLFHLYRSSFVVKNGLVNEISLKKKTILNHTYMKIEHLLHPKMFHQLRIGIRRPDLGHHSRKISIYRR